MVPHARREHRLAALRMWGLRMRGFAMKSPAILRKGAVLAVLALPLTLGACATTQSVEDAKAAAAKAQSTADQALAEAKAASAKADEAAAKADAASAKADAMFNKSLKKTQ